MTTSNKSGRTSRCIRLLTVLDFTEFLQKSPCSACDLVTPAVELNVRLIIIMKKTSAGNTILTILPVVATIVIDGLFIISLALGSIYDSAYSFIVTLLCAPFLILATILSGVMYWRTKKLGGNTLWVLSALIFVALSSFWMVGFLIHKLVTQQ